MASRTAEIFVKMIMDQHGVQDGLDSLKNSLRRIGEFTAGNLLADAFVSAGRALGALKDETIDAVGDFERLEQTLTNMVTLETLRDTATKKMIKTEGQAASTLSVTGKTLQDNTAEIAIQVAQIKVWERTVAGANANAIELAKTQGPTGHDYLKASANAELYAAKIQLAKEKIVELQAAQTPGAAAGGAMKQVLEYTMSYADAMASATPRVAELVKWVSEIGVKSPFTEETVTKVFQYGMGMNMGVDRSQKLTAAIVDFSAATGRSNAETYRMGMALSQVYAKGKLMGEEIRQLTNAGVGLNIMAEAMGMSVEEFTAKQVAGKIKADELLDSFIKLSSERFPRAAERVAMSWAGLPNTFEDIRRLSLRDLFMPALRAIAPILGLIVQNFSDLRVILSNIGKSIGAPFQTASDKIVPFLTTLFKTKEAIHSSLMTPFDGVVMAMIPFEERLVRASSLLGISSGRARLLAKGLTDFAASVKNVIKSGFDTFTNKILPAFGKAIGWALTHWDAFKGALKGVGALFLATNAITAVISIVTLLINPLTLAIAAAALLGAAWSTNWLNIRERTALVWDTISSIFNSIANWMTGGSKVKDLSTDWDASWRSIEGSIENAWKKIEPVLTKVRDWAKTELPGQLNTMRDKWREVWGALSTEAAKFKEPFDTIMKGVKDHFQGLQDKAPESIKAMDEAWKTIGPALSESISGLAATVGFLADNWKILLTVITGVGTIQATSVAVFNLSNAMSIFAISLSTLKPAALFGGLINIISKVALFLGTLNPIVFIVIGAIAALAAAWILNLGDIQGKTAAAITWITARFAEFSTWITTTWSSLTTTVSGATTTFVDWITKRFDTLSAWFSTTFAPAIQLVGQIFTELGSRISEAGAAFMDPFKTGTSILDTFKASIGSGVKFIVDGFNSLVASAAPIKEALSGLVNALPVEQVRGFFQLFLDADWSVITKAVDFIRDSWRTGLAAIIGNWDAVIEAARVTTNFIGNAFQVVAEIAGRFAQDILEAGAVIFNALAAVAGAIMANIGGAITGVIHIVTAFVNAVVGAITTLVNTIIALMAGDFTGAFSTFKEGLLGIWGSVVDGISGAAEVIRAIVFTIGDAIANFATSLGVTGIAEKWQEIKNGITNLDLATAVTNIFNGARTAIATSLAGIAADAANSRTELMLAGMILVTQIGEGVTNAYNSVVSAILNSPLIASIRAIGKDMSDGMWNGLVEGVTSMIASIPGEFTKLIDSVKAVFGIKSPSTVFADIGTNLIQGLIDGITAMLGKLGEIGGAIFDKIAGLFGGGSTKKKDNQIQVGMTVPLEQMEALRLWIEETMPLAITSFNTFWISSWDSIVSALTISHDRAVVLFTTLLDWLSNKLVAALSLLVSTSITAWNSILSTVTSTIESMIGRMGDLEAAIRNRVMSAFDAFKAMMATYRLDMGGLNELEEKLRAIEYAAHKAHEALNGLPVDTKPDSQRDAPFRPAYGSPIPVTVLSMNNQVYRRIDKLSEPNKVLPPSYLYRIGKLIGSGVSEGIRLASHLLSPGREIPGSSALRGFGITPTPFTNQNAWFAMGAGWHSESITPPPFPSRNTSLIAGAGTGRGEFQSQINIYANVNNDLDIEVLAFRVADYMNGRR